MTWLDYQHLETRLSTMRCHRKQVFHRLQRKEWIAVVVSLAEVKWPKAVYFMLFKQYFADVRVL
jgi:hypothetical protein